MARFNYDQLTKIWRASSRDRSLTREDLASVEIDRVTAALLESAPDMSLRAEGHFVYGISQIWGEKAQNLLRDSQEADANVGIAFREYLQALLRSQSSDDGPTEHRVTAGADLELPTTLNIPQSLLGPSSHRPAAEGDLSIDAVMRGGEDDDIHDLSDAENVVRSAEDQAALEGLDLGLGDDLGLDDGPSLGEGPGDEPGNLDFGSDLAYSSSPPHTPAGDEDLGVAINGSSSPRAPMGAPTPKRRRRGAPVDEVITIARPRKPAHSILRSLPEDRGDLNESHEVRDEDFDDEDAYIPLDDATERLLDPKYVEEEMRRRRRAESDEMDVEEQDHSVTFGDISFDNDLDFGGNDLELEDEEEDTPEALETEQRKAHETVRGALRRKGDRVEFDDLAVSSKARACTLMEILSLAARGQVAVDQTESWGSVQITKV